MQMTTGERIRQARKAANMTQTELADKIGVKFSAIHKYETGMVVNLKRETIAALAEALNVRPSWLMCMEEPEDSPDLHSLAYQSADEQWIIKMYRKADEYDKETVRRLLGRYDEEGNQTSEKSG